MATIALVDDNIDSLHFLRRFLEFAGHVAVCLPAGPAAVSCLKQMRPDLLLLDVMMPQLSGIELLKLLRDDPCLADLKVVMLSGVNDLDVQSEAFQLGALDYIVKDMNWEKSLERIDIYLKKN